jgi:hypothetical protein
MLTESQFKVLMILFDDKGHAGWELAEALGMEESNLNPLLKRLEKRKYIFQGLPRKSNRPKKLKEYKKSNNVEKIAVIEKREGDYKEFPYYLNKDIYILGTIIREMVLTNKSYDTGFPFRFIKTSSYIKSMRDLFKEDLNKCLVISSRELPEAAKAEEIERSVRRVVIRQREQTKAPKFRDKRVSKRLLKEIELWYNSYLERQHD